MPNEVTIQSFTIPGIHYKGAIAKLRRYYTVDWTDQNGVLHLAGQQGSLTDCFEVANCTISNNVLTVPEFSAAVTLFNGANPYAREIWQLWDQSNKPRNVITGDGGWFIPDSPNPTTREILDIANQGQYLIWPPNHYLNSVQVQQLIDAELGLINFGVSGIATMIGGVATVARTSMTASGGARGAPLTPMSGSLHCEVTAGVGFSIISNDGGDEGPILWTAYDDLS